MTVVSHEDVRAQLRDDIGPLHPGPCVYACRVPERPFDLTFGYDSRCRACVVHAVASIKNGKDGRLPTDEESPLAQLGESMTLGEFVAIVAPLHGLEYLL